MTLPGNRVVLMPGVVAFHVRTVARRSGKRRAVRVKPRVVAFIPSYFPSIGGAEISLRQVAQRLSDQFDFQILTSRVDRQRPRRELLDHACVWRLGPGTSLDKWLLPPAAVLNWKRVSTGDGTTRPHLLWGIDISQGALAAAILRGRQHHVRMVLTIQYGGGEARLRKGRLGFIRRSFQYMLAQTDHVTAVSSPLLEFARHQGYRGGATLIPNGVDLSLFHPAQDAGVRERTERVVTVSRLERKNGIDTLLHAISLLAERLPGIECWIVGDGPERRSLENLVAELGLSSRASFLGTLSQTEVARRLRECDVFVRPSRTEGLGNAFLEAMASGLPVVGTTAGGLIDVIQDGRTGLVSLVDRPEDLAQKIHRLLGDREYARSIALAGLQYVREGFDAEDTARQYARLFWSLLEA